MSAAGSASSPPSGGAGLPSDPFNLLFTILRYAGLMLLNALGLVIIYGFISDDNLSLAIVFAVITVGANIITFVPALYPLRWMTPGLMLVTLLVIYPIIITVVTSTTNYNNFHLFTKAQAVRLLERQRYVPEGAATYAYQIFQNEAGEFALWLSREGEGGALEVAFAPAGAPIVAVANPPAEPPETYEGYRLLAGADRTAALTAAGQTVFGIGDDTAQISSRREAARPLVQRYVYDPATDRLTDNQTGTVYVADNKTGFFTRENSAETLSPGFRVSIGLDNFSRLVSDPGLRGPLVDIFVWTVVFAFLSVVTTFAVGLAMALVLNDPIVRGRKIIRSLLIIPYAMPGVISILVWRGMLDQNLGIITRTIADTFGVQLQWFSDPALAKVAIIIVNLWLGYPYMMLVTSGALQAIPSDVYEAAAVDGANPSQRFWQITMPLLLVTVGPLLIASFVYNFNNYMMIELLTRGDPPIPGSPTPAGYTDILISYTYSLAFGSNQGADYGYASAITIVIFILVAIVTLMQYRFTRSWEEVSENV